MKVEKKKQNEEKEFAADGGGLWELARRFIGLIERECEVNQKLSQLKLLLFGSLKNDLCQYASHRTESACRKAPNLENASEQRRCRNNDRAKNQIHKMYINCDDIIRQRGAHN